MDITLDDAVFVVHWMVSRSVAEVGRRRGEPMADVLTAASRLRGSGWPLPPRPAEDPAPRRGRKPALAPHPADPAAAAWVDGDGKTWGPAAGGDGCFRCGKPTGRGGFNRRDRRGEPGRKSACGRCVRLVALPPAWTAG